jgi:DNA-binding MarR family transcriptional regulator
MATPEPKHPRYAYAIADLLLSLGRSIEGDAAKSTLNAVQWSALRFVSTSNPSSRTIGAFAKLQQTTPSSASQTISSLVRHGFLRKTPGIDRRVKILEITAKGERLLASDPIHELAARVTRLGREERFLLAATIEKLIRPDTADKQ